MAQSSHITAADHTCFQDAMPEQPISLADSAVNTEDPIHTSVGVLDKAVRILEALEAGPTNLGHLVSATGLARPTVHRLATALEQHRFVCRDEHGRYTLGARFGELAAVAGEDLLLNAAKPILHSLRNRTGESAQIFRRQGEHRICIAAADRAAGLHNSIPAGAVLSMHTGAAAQVLLAWDSPERIHQVLYKAQFSATKLADVRRRGWAESINESEAGACSISAPIRGLTGQVMAAISISGPLERMGSAPGRLYAPLVMAAGKYLSESLHSTSVAHSR